MTDRFHRDLPWSVDYGKPLTELTFVHEDDTIARSRQSKVGILFEAPVGTGCLSVSDVTES